MVCQIFPDCFNNGNPHGEIQGRKKDSFIYATKEDSPYYIKDEHGDIARWDFFGGNLEGIRQIKDLHKNRIALILDGVFNHVGADSKYFLSAVTDKTGPYYSWFNFINYPTKYQSWWGEPRFLKSTRVMLTTITSSAGPTAF
ncbi:alpha-amylase family glycosyl hydrolase [Lactobacillus delbrueckii]|uniref:alpha-amylase family glycosyl hydrolase n=1 Tax=Lactobacillus delbrueckii TaxID=1584 RepID=UPI0037CBEE76